MADDRIESIIDTGKINVEIEFLKKNLAEMKATIMQFPAIKTKMEGADQVKELSKELENLQAEHKKLIQTTNERVAAESRLTAAQQQSIAATQQAVSSVEDNIKARIRYQNTLASIRGEEKDNLELLRAGTITQKEYRERMVESAVAQEKLKVRISETSKAIKDQISLQEISSNAPGSIREAQKQNLVLTAQRNLVPDGDTEKLAKLNALIDRNNDLIDKNSDSLSKRKINIGNYEASAKLIVDALEKEKIKLQSLTGSYQNFTNQVQVSRNVITGFAGGITGQTGFKAAQTDIIATAGKIGVLKSEIVDSRGKIEGFNKTLSSDEFTKFAKKAEDGKKSTNAFAAGVGKAYGGVRLLANILPGLGISGVFLLAYEAIKYAVEALGLFNKKVSEAAKSADTLNKAFETSSYSEAVKDVENLRIQIGLAKDGFINKTEVVKIYNDTIGKATGEINTLAEAEDFITKAADAYIKMTLYKAAANLALEDAAKKALEAEQNRAKKLSEFNTVGTRASTFGAGQTSAPGFVPSLNDPTKALAAQEKAAADSKKKRIKEAEDEKNVSLNIAKKFNEDAAKIAKEFDFFPTAKAKKGSKSTSKDSVKATLDSEFEIYKIAQQRKIALLNEGLSDESKTFDERIAILQSFSKESIDLSNAQLANDLRVEKEKLAAQQKNLSGAKGTEKNNLLIEIANTNTKIKTLEAKNFDERLKILDENQKKFTEIQKSADAQEEKRRKEAYDKELSDAESNALEIKSATVRRYEEMNQALSESFIQGGISKEDYYEQKAKQEFDFHVQSIRNELEYAKKILDIQKVLGVDTKKQQEAIAKLSTELEAIILKESIDSKEKQLKADEDYAKKKADLYKQLYSELGDTIKQFLDDGLKREEQDLEEKQRLLDEDTKRKISAIDQLGLTEIERKKQVSAVEKQAQFQTEQIEKRKRAIAVERAKFDKAANIANIIATTAVAVVKALAIGPPQGIVLAALTGAIGALQLAKAISTPLPKYFKGTDNAKKGPGMYGEIGRELVIPTSGKPYLSPGIPTLTSFMGGETIVPADMTANLLARSGMQRLAGMNMSKPVTVDSVNAHIMGSMLGELKDLNKKSRIIINASSDINFKAYIAKNIN